MKGLLLYLKFWNYKNKDTQINAYDKDAKQNAGAFFTTVCCASFAPIPANTAPNADMPNITIKQSAASMPMPSMSMGWGSDIAETAFVSAIIPLTETTATKTRVISTTRKILLKRLI